MFALKHKFGGNRKQRGVAVVECVIILPVVLFIMLAVAEMANLILTYNTLTRTVRDGARYISSEAGAGPGVIQLTDDKIERTQNLTVYGKITAGGKTVLPGMTTDNVVVNMETADDVFVSAVYNYQPLFVPVIPGIGGARMTGSGFEMTTKIVMTVL